MPYVIGMFRIGKLFGNGSHSAAATACIGPNAQPHY